MSTTTSRVRLSALLKEYAAGGDTFSDIYEWLCNVPAEDVIWLFERAVESKLFGPGEVWLLMMCLYEAVNPSHLRQLERVHRAMAILDDEDKHLPRSAWTKVSFGQVLCDFELILKRKGMRATRIIELRNQNWRGRASLIDTLQSWAGGGNWHVEIPSGLPSLGKRR